MIIPSRTSVGAVALVSLALLLNGSTVNADASEVSATPEPKTAIRVPVAVDEPRILLTGAADGFSDESGLEVSMDFINAGKESVTIVGIGRSGPGMQLLTAERRGPYVILPGEAMALHLKYRVTNCKTVPRGTWPIPLRVLRPKGEETIYLDRSTAGTADPWHRRFLRDTCGSR